MPQLDVFSYFSTIFWVFNAFLGLVFFNYAYTIPKIVQNLNVRDTVFRETSTEYYVVDEEGNLVYDEFGNIQQYGRD